jgi:hypothetical protein
MMRERLYDGACLLISNKAQRRSGKYREPSPELSFQNFISSLLAKVIADAKSQGGQA